MADVRGGPVRTCGAAPEGDRPAEQLRSAVGQPDDRRRLRQPRIGVTSAWIATVACANVAQTLLRRRCGGVRRIARITGRVGEPRPDRRGTPAGAGVRFISLGNVRIPMTDDDPTGPWILALGALALGTVAVTAELLRQRRADGRNGDGGAA